VRIPVVEDDEALADGMGHGRIQLVDLLPGQADSKVRSALAILKPRMVERRASGLSMASAPRAKYPRLCQRHWGEARLASPSSAGQPLRA
jgi:hypothetical protein